MAKRTDNAAKTNPAAASILGALDAASQPVASVAGILNAADLIPFVRVLNPKGEDLQQMERWPLAVELLQKFWPENKRSIIIKARQLGVSWDFALYALFHLGWKRYRTLGSVNYNQEVAGELIARMRVLWESMPLSLRPRVRGEWSDKHVEFENGSRAIALATKNVSGAGYTFSMMGIDEAGLIENLGDNWAALLPAVEHGELHLFSTPREDTNKYAEIIKSARAGTSSFKLRECQWWERPDRDQNTEQGRAWLAARKSELTPQEFDREYGLQFARSGSCYFRSELVKRLRAKCRQPEQIIWGGRLRLFAPLSQLAIEPNVIGADVAEGLEGGDYSSAGLMRRRSGEMLATYHGHVDTTEYAEDLVHLGQIGGNAWMGIEANNHGHAVCNWVYKHLRYRRVLRENREAEGNMGAQSASRLGILTTTSTKPAMLAETEHGLEKDTIHIYDAGVIEELESFRRLPGGGYGAAGTAHDDRVMMLLLTQNARGRHIPRCA